jgi:hypothetical protein
MCYYLCHRLESYDRNDNFGATEVVQQEFTMALPVASGYRYVFLPKYITHLLFLFADNNSNNNNVNI